MYHFGLKSLQNVSLPNLVRLYSESKGWFGQSDDSVDGGILTVDGPLGENMLDDSVGGVISTVDDPLGDNMLDDVSRV